MSMSFGPAFAAPAASSNASSVYLSMVRTPPTRDGTSRAIAWQPAMIAPQPGRAIMLAFDLGAEQAFNPQHHVEKILGVVGEGDVTVACWEPGQTSPNHLHPNATEIYFCFSGGGVMHTPTGDVDVRPGCFV